MGRFVDRSNNNGADRYDVAGVSDLYLKATEGTAFVDASRRNRNAQARAEGVRRIGFYHFADLKDPLAEAEHFLSVIGKPRAGQLRPCLDFEKSTGTVHGNVAWAEAFVRHCKRVLGYWPALYGSTSIIGPMRASSKTLRQCPWWRAEYGVDDGHEHALAGGRQGATVHQYTSHGRVSGLSGYADLSVYVAPATRMRVPTPWAIAGVTLRAWHYAQWLLSVGPYRKHGFRSGHKAPRKPKRGILKAIAALVKR